MSRQLRVAVCFLVALGGCTGSRRSDGDPPGSPPSPDPGGSASCDVGGTYTITAPGGCGGLLPASGLPCSAAQSGSSVSVSCDGYGSGSCTLDAGCACDTSLMGIAARVDFRGGSVAFEADGVTCVASIDSRGGATDPDPDAGPTRHDAGPPDPPAATGRWVRCTCDFYCDGDLGGITPEYPAVCSDESLYSLERDHERICEDDEQVVQWCDLLGSSVSDCSCGCVEGGGC